MSTSTTKTARRRFKPVTAFFIILIHVGALAAVFPYFFSWAALALCLVLIWMTASLGVSLSYHRLLSHRAWRAKPWLRNALTFLACLSLQMGPIGWSATHRLHHRESDHEADPHSPLVNFFWAHLGWIFYTHPEIDDEASKRKLVPDLYSDRAMRFFEHTFFAHWIVVGLLSLGIGYWIGGLQFALSLFVWGSLVRTVWVWHCTWFVNSVTHLFGYRNYATADDSRNLWWVSLVTFGEGWHNNHHAIAGGANFGHKWFEFDPTYWALALFNRLGWVEKINASPRLKVSSAIMELSTKIAAQSRALKSMLRAKQPMGATDW